MYLPAHFEETRRDVILDFVRDHPFGLLVTHSADGIAANGLPFMLDVGPADGPLGTLRGHVARSNPVWREAVAAPTALVVFQGPQAYISPSGYASKREHGKVVPTWNYVMVQARGSLRAVQDAGWLRAFVGRLTTRHEASRSHPWGVDDAPKDFIDTMLLAIVGIEIELTDLSGKWKASQNRSTADRAGVAQELGLLGNDNARAMARQVHGPRADA